MITLRNRDRIKVRATLRGRFGAMDVWKTGIVGVSEPEYRHQDLHGEHVWSCMDAAVLDADGTMEERIRKAQEYRDSCTTLALGDAVNVDGEGIFEVYRIDPHSSDFVRFRPVAEVRS